MSEPGNTIELMLLREEVAQLRAQVQGLLSHQQVTDQMLLLMTEIINALPVGAAVEEEEQIGAASPEAIAVGTNTYLQLGHDVEKGTEDVCSICRENIGKGEEVSEVMQVNHCGHVYHLVCLTGWFSVDSRCPNCRHNLSA